MTPVPTVPAATFDPGRPRTLLPVHLLPVGATAFLFVYAAAVCPFIDGLTPGRLALGLGMVAALHLVLRLVAWRLVPAVGGLARHGFRLSVVTWGLAGLIALAVHGLRYPDFPWHSHFKLLVGYWVLGAGVMAQLEYVLLERLERGQGGSGAPSDRLSRRLLESFAVFTIAPGGALALLVVRHVMEGRLSPGIAGEALFLAAVLILGALGVAWNYGRILGEDTARLITALEAVAAGRFDIRLDRGRGDELGRVAGAVEDMAAGLRQREVIRDAFGRFVSPQVAEAFLRDHADAAPGSAPRLGGVRQDVTVLLCDLRDFTPLAERLEPEALTTLLNGYLTAMVDAVADHGGVVDKFMGDAVMVVFGLAGEADHAPRAVACARDMAARLAAFSHGGHAPPLRHGIGIHSGPVVAGLMGAPQRLEFTVIGATVNIAARIESHARDPLPAILMSKATADRVPPGTARPVAVRPLKGVQGEAPLYGVV